MLRSCTLVCPGGLVRTSHVSLKSRLIYTKGILPGWLQNWIVTRRLQPQSGGGPSADVPVDDVDDIDIDFDAVPLSKGTLTPKVGDVMGWQMRTNEGYVGAYLSTIRNSPIYGQHDSLWQTLRQRLAERRPVTASGGDGDGNEVVPAGLPGGKICLVLAEKDPVVITKEWIEDSKLVLGDDAVIIHVVSGGHEIAISKGATVADLAMSSWVGI